MAVRIQIRRGTAAEWAAANPVLMEGELGVELDTGKWKTGDGVRAWSDLDYVYDAGAVDALQSDLVAHKGAAAPHSGHATTTALSSHLADLANPHAVTAAQIPYTSTVVGFDPALVSAGLDVLAGGRIVDHNLDVVDPPNGYYMRAENGWQMCWANPPDVEGISVEPGGTYVLPHYPHPANFSGAISVASVGGYPTNANGDRAYSPLLGYGTAIHWSSPFFKNKGNFTVTRVVYLQFFAIGRWK